MKLINLKTIFLLFVSQLFIAGLSNAQQGDLVVNQDKNITTLLNAKKELNKESNDYYKIQIYSGARNSAQKAKGNFNLKFNKWPSKMVYETPNFKIWVGNYRTRLEADRALNKIKREFPSAFIFKPKK